MADSPLTLEDIHLLLYPHLLTLYVSPEDRGDTWFIIPNPAFTSGIRTPGSPHPEVPYVFRILASGPNPQAAYQEWIRKGRPEQ